MIFSFPFGCPNFGILTHVLPPRLSEHMGIILRSNAPAAFLSKLLRRKSNLPLRDSIVKCGSGMLKTATSFASHSSRIDRNSLAVRGNTSPSGLLLLSNGCLFHIVDYLIHDEEQICGLLNTVLVLSRIIGIKSLYNMTLVVLQIEKIKRVGVMTSDNINPYVRKTLESQSRPLTAAVSSTDHTLALSLRIVYTRSAI